MSGARAAGPMSRDISVPGEEAWVQGRAGSLLVTGYLVSWLFCSLPGSDVLFSRCTRNTKGHRALLGDLESFLLVFHLDHDSAPRGCKTTHNNPSRPPPLLVIIILDFTYFYFTCTGVYVRNVYLTVCASYARGIEKWASNLLELQLGGDEPGRGCWEVNARSSSRESSQCP